MENFSEVTQLLSTERITYFEKSGSILDIIQAMLERTQYDTGFFIVDLSTVIGQYEQWVTLLPRVRPFYAVKSNPDPTIIKTLAILGAGFDCASKNEIKQVLEIVNNDSSRIIFANPFSWYGDGNGFEFCRVCPADKLVAGNVFSRGVFSRFACDSGTGALFL